MNIAVLAANGRTGRKFVEHALAAGHSVRAGIYRTNNLPEHEGLEVVSCDATSRDDVAKLIEGQDAVVSFIGHAKGSPDTVQADAMRVLVDAAKEAGVTRAVSLTGTGVRFDGDKITIVDRFLNLGISVVDPARVKDGREHVEVLKQSGLDWTVIRVLKLQNTKPRPYTLREHGPTKWFVSREEVTASVLEVLEKESFTRHAPIIAKN